jgi:hypothetical protein
MELIMEYDSYDSYSSIEEDLDNQEQKQEGEQQVEESKKRRRIQQPQQLTLNGEKKCINCGKIKPIDAYGKRKDKGIFSIRNFCLECKKTYDQIWWYKKKYNLSLEEIQNRITQQNNLCEICGNIIEFIINQSGKSTACVDHDHKTGKVRGLLCAYCNTAIGMLKDSPEFCRNAANYLEKHAKET